MEGGTDVRVILFAALVLAVSCLSALGEDCHYFYVEEVDECPGAYAYSVCTEVNPETGSVITRVYDDGCAYVVNS